MFLVLIEYIEDGGKEWSVVAHDEMGLRSIFSTREKAEDHAMELAKEQTNRFAVVEIKSWYQQEAQEIKVEEVHLISGGGTGPF